MQLDRCKKVLPWAVGLVVAAATPHAIAGKLSVRVQPTEAGAVVQMSSDDGTLADPKIARSRTGMMLVFPGEEVEPQRLYSRSRRLRFVQTGMGKHGAAVRIVQRPSARGPIREFAHLRPVPGGYEVEVVDSYPPAPETEHPASPQGKGASTTSPGSPANTDSGPLPDRASALERLSDALEGGNAPAPATVASSDAAGTGAREHRVEVSPPAAPDPAPSVETGPRSPATAEYRVAAASGAPLPPEDDPLDGDRDRPAPEEATIAPSGRRGSPIALYGMVGLFAAAGGLGFWWRKRRGTEPSRRVEVRERIAVGPKQAVLCVRIGGRELLIGATEHSMSLLADLEPVDVPPSSSTPTPGAKTADERPTADSGDTVGDGVEGARGSRPRDAARARLAAFQKRLAEAMRTTEEDTSVPPPHQVEFSNAGRDPAWVRHREVA